MAVTTGNVTVDQGLNKKTLVHTVEAGCTLLLATSNQSYGDVDNPTAVSSSVDGAFTLLDSNITTPRAGPQLWYLVSPTVGAHTITFTETNSFYSVIASVSVLGSAVASIFGTVAKANGSSTTPSVSVASATGELVIDVCTYRKASGDLTATVDASQAQLVNASSGTGTTQGLGLISTEAGAASVTMSWTGTVSNIWRTMGVSIKPAAASGGRLVGGVLLGQALAGGVLVN